VKIPCRISSHVDGDAATVEQFIQCFADASGRDLTQFMRWYSQAGRRKSWPTVILMRRARLIRLNGQIVPPTRSAGQGANGYSLSLGLVGKDGRDLSPAFGLVG
jgi:aminopeptidase N